MLRFFATAVSYIKAAFSGTLGFCERCGSFTQVLQLGENYRQHFAYLKKHHGLEGEIPEALLSKFGCIKLCMYCNGDVELAAGLHNHCCKKVFSDRVPYLNGYIRRG